MVKITYNGKTYKNIEDAFGKAFDAAIKKGIVNVIEEKIKPHQSEIDNCGGWIEVVFDKDGYNANVNFHDMPIELATKLKELLS